jgi:hypothetical protein
MRVLMVACCLWAILMIAPPLSAEEGRLPKLAADKADVERLGEEFKDERIRLRAPKDLQRVEVELNPELINRGFYSYAWAPEGKLPSIEVINLTCAPQLQDSRETIDDGVAGFHESLRRGFEAVTIGNVKKGLLRGTEVRAGEFKGSLNGQRVFAVYLMGLDAKGMFSLMATMPEEKATDERVKLVQAALLTFQRTQPE